METKGSSEERPRGGRPRQLLKRVGGEGWLGGKETSIGVGWEGEKGDGGRG